MFARFVYAAGFLLGIGVTPALADFTVCNESDSSTASVSVAYQSDGEWVSEGWWNIDRGDCTIIFPGDLKSRYYYIRADGGDGTWKGDYNFCYKSEKFTIYGDENCSSRGYKSGGYFEVDTGDSYDWTQRLVE